MQPLDIRIGLLRAGITMVEISRRKNVTAAFVSMALAGKRTSQRALKIRNYAIGLIQRKAA